MKKGFIQFGLLAIVGTVILVVALILILSPSVIGNPGGEPIAGCNAPNIATELSGTVTLDNTGIFDQQLNIRQINDVSVRPLSFLDADGDLTLTLLNSNNERLNKKEIQVDGGIFGNDEVVPFTLDFVTKDYNCDNVIDNMKLTLKAQFVNEDGKITRDDKIINIVGGDAQ